VLDHALQELLRPFDLTPTQYNVLRILRGAGKDGLCGREVGERMLTRVPDVPRLLERMEVSGLVRRERDTEDRRHVTARITPKGLSLLERIDPSLKGFQRRRLGRLGADEIDALIRALDTLREL
jgi:DNA-binding MarR family transcriptional regulator